MKAIIHPKYGAPSVLSFEDVDKPIPKDNELLVKVCAATVNRTDCAMLRAKPFIMRFMTGLFKPKKPTLGTDFSGIVEAIGNKVASFKVGDKVFGFDDAGVCSHGQYMTIAQDNAIELIPDNTSFKQAAASLEGAHYAINIINKVDLKSGQTVLVNGASGAIGSALVQILKHFGAKVTAVCNTQNVALIKSIGADKVIDYLKEDFTQSNEKYNYVFDAVGKSSFSKCKPLLERGGIYISSELGWMGQNVFFALLKPIIGNKKVIFPIPKNRLGSVRFIKKLIEQEKFSAVIDREYLLEQVPEAFSYVETGEKTGNVVISIV